MSSLNSITQFDDITALMEGGLSQQVIICKQEGVKWTFLEVVSSGMMKEKAPYKEQKFSLGLY